MRKGLQKALNEVICKFIVVHFFVHVVVAIMHNLNLLQESNDTSLNYRQIFKRNKQDEGTT